MSNEKLKCDNDGCENEVPEDNIDRVCAYQLDHDTPNQDFRGLPTCNCCNKCRDLCHEGLFEQS